MREAELLQHIYAASRAMPDSVTIGPGDDMGAVNLGGQTVLVTVDQVADGVHVNTATTPLELVGRKAIVRNLSDVAAMGALPSGAVAAACLPSDFGAERANTLFDAMRQTAERYHCPLLGGDVSVWGGALLLTVTVFADPAGVEPVLRSGAQVNDGVYVTGELGRSWDEQGGGPHLSAEPRIALARQLAQDPQVDLHAMIDLSDGLATDLGHICERSRVGAVIDEIAIPCRQGGSANNALSDGEDYELCFTAAGVVPGSIDGVMIARIGRVVEADGAGRIVMRHKDGRAEPLAASGWEHRGE